MFQIYRSLSTIKHQVLLSVFGVTSYCKHTPTCSRYAEQQIQKHGILTGSLKGIKRLLTCW